MGDWDPATCCPCPCPCPCLTYAKTIAKAVWVSEPIFIAIIYVMNAEFIKDLTLSLKYHGICDGDGER